ncbi:MAG TPA: ATP-grasp domain-containing protein [Planctomycetaceae bacterium]|nr:ATP-grasp domain-containing protein [Planctomycetaceae bacterium]
MSAEAGFAELDPRWRNRFRGSRLLFLPGGRWQVPVIRVAQQMGLVVICADGTPDAPGFLIADEAIQVPLQDVASLVRIGRERRIDAVMTEQTDFAVPLVAQVAAELGLKGLPPDVARAATHKGRMRECAAAAGIRQPAFRVCRTVEEAIRAVAELGLPVFCKPADGQSSRGVSRINEPSDSAIQAAFERARAASQVGETIFEQFVDGTEATVEGFVVDGRPTTLAISDKERYADLPGVARTLTWPGNFPPEVAKRIARASEATVRALGIPFGITHGEFLVDAQGEPWLVEMAARGGGTRIPSHIVPAVCGFEPTPALIAILLGDAPEVLMTQERAAQLRFLRLPPGKRILGFPNLAELQQTPGVVEIAFNQAVGERVPAVQDDRSRHGYVIVSADNAAAARALAEQIERELIVDTSD